MKAIVTHLQVIVMGRDTEYYITAFVNRLVQSMVVLGFYIHLVWKIFVLVSNRYAIWNGRTKYSVCEWHDVVNNATEMKAWPRRK